MFLFPLLLLALPLIEIAVFVVVGSQIGVLSTIGLVILSGVVGTVLLRIQGFGVLTRIQREMEAGRNPGRELAHGAMIMFAGVLLLIPGFVTDIVGLLLFIPPVRDLGWRLIRSRITVVGEFGAGRWRSSSPEGRAGRKTIDLDADDYSKDDYSKDPGKSSPWRKLDKE